MVVAVAAFSLSGAPLFSANAAGSSVIDVWWPTNTATVSGVQPFKAMLENADVSAYNMFWQVDGGQYNAMPTSNQDYPHKEAAVDVTSWYWQSSENYNITFIAQDLSGKELARTSVVIHVDHGTAAQAQAPAPAQVSTPAPAPVVQSAPATQTVAAVAAPAVSATVSTGAGSGSGSGSSAPTAATVAQTSATPAVNISSPANDATVNGSVSFAATLAGADPNSYYMFWEVGYGQYNIMPSKSATVDVSSWNWEPSGNYTITFIAQDLTGKEIARNSIVIHVGNSVQGVTVTAPVSTPVAPVVQNPVVTIAPSSASDDVFAGTAVYRNPNNSAQQAADAIKQSDPANAALLQTLANSPTAVWFGGWNSNVQQDVDNVVTAAAAANQVPVLVVYNVPDRDCGGYSAGGATDASQYAQWIQSFAAGIKGRKAAVILEPDGTTVVDCLSSSGQQARYAMLASAVKTLSAAGASVYIDAGHSAWVDPNTEAQRLQQADIADAAGFSLNVSNYMTTSDNVAFGDQLSALLGGKHFVVDTSRNGNGPTTDSQWCNPSGRAIGAAPTTMTGDSHADAFLWIKTPGESDGTCNGGPSAGVFWPSYAETLVANAH